MLELRELGELMRVDIVVEPFEEIDEFELEIGVKRNFEVLCDYV